ncbi:hypothetical protein [Amaricoccus solimangrovi]|uniref:DUF3299 domain-containing protein n=1 Tax=Amaricoccus solimangrovi TaxID=2589815 RepID=A0A501WRG3_9RHOB|nr:hypothetical protein [Amaricoccus solimangrovi]TPE49867.1 hypothetical protein FJM51_12945 [Amaricoccus solimangrovi]
MIRQSRRAVLLATVCLAVAAAARAGEGSGTLAFDELYGKVGVLGLSFSDKLRALKGQTVRMKGFMAPPLKAEAKFFVLTKRPMALCPFCSSDADWPADIVVVYLDRAQTFEQANALIEVTGTLEVGSWTDPETGFVSQVRIVGARFDRV